MATPDEKVASAATTSSIPDEVLEQISRGSAGRSESTPTPERPEKSATAGGIPVTTTRPDQILRHDISDEELDVLTSSKSNEAMWTFIGIAGGAFVPAAYSFVDAFIKDHATPLNWIGLLQIILLVGGGGIALALKISGGQKTAPAIAKAQEIRERTNRS